MKKFIIILFVLMLVVSIFPINQTQNCVYAEEQLSASEIEEILEESIGSQLDDLDFSELEEILASLGDEGQEIFGNESFVEKLKQILNGDLSNYNKSIWTSILNLFFEDVLSFLPVLSLVIAIAVMFSLVNASKPSSKNKSIGDVIHFVCFGAIIVLLVGYSVKMLTLTSNTLQSIKAQMDIALPILLTVLTAIGGVTSVSVYQPAVAILSGTIINIFTNILMPIFIFRLVFSIVGNLSNNVKLDKFASFFSSLFKWIVGGVFTVFSAFLTIQGITAGSVDGISFRTAKYAIKNSIPLVGSYLSDGLNLIVASSVLIKNAVGATGLVLLFSTIIVPILNLIVFMLSLKLVSAILEPITDSRISNFISMLAKSISLLIVLIIGCAFMYLIMTGMIMVSANFF